MTGADFYTFFHQQGNQWGPTFQGVEHAWLGDQEGWSRVVVPEPLRAGNVSLLFPSARSLTAAGHILGGDHYGGYLSRSRNRRVRRTGDRPGGDVRPVERDTALLACARVTPTADPKVRRGDVRVFDENGRLISDLSGARLHYLESAQQDVSLTANDSWFYKLAWREMPFADTVSEPTEASHDWLILTDGEHQTTLAQALARVRMQGVLNAMSSTILSDRSIDGVRAALTGRKSVSVITLVGFV